MLDQEKILITAAPSRSSERKRTVAFFVTALCEKQRYAAFFPFEPPPDFAF